MTDHYAVVGHPIAHSKSPLIHAEFARQTSQDLAYDRLLAPLDGFAEVVAAFRAGGGAGLNVTVPFKEQAFELAPRRTPRAQAAGAVNTLKFEAGDILGDNTDGAGLARDLTRNLGVPINRKQILLIGAGGAARGVIGPLLQEEPAALVLVNRTSEKAEQLARQFDLRLSACGYEDLNEQSFDIVINATSASLTGHVPDLPTTIFAPGALAYDMMYGMETAFMAWARNHGAHRVADGLGMLVEQAAESFHLWRGIRPDTRSVITQLSRP
ncbi:MAG TPA: shikimate dehydrogenase [Thiobacillaceae bacterium]|nr:shikimate dehydrogenase [Thiobacillaceae bacterium]